MSTTPRHFASILISPENASIKRIAWAFGCSKKNSDEERELYQLLLDKTRHLLAQRGEP